MLHKALPLVTLLFISACTRSGDLSYEVEQDLASERTHGVLINECDLPQGTRSGEGVPATGLYDLGGCQVYVYSTPQFGEPLPPGWSISYCVCGDRNPSDPVTGPLEGGWTYPMSTCRHDWSNH